MTSAKYIFYGLIIGIVLGTLIGVIWNLRVENDELRGELRRTIYQLQGAIDPLQEALNKSMTTTQIPNLNQPPEIVYITNEDEFWPIIKSKITGGGVCGGQYYITTRQEIERFLAYLAKDPIYKSLGSSAKPYLEMSKLIEWNKGVGLAIGLVMAHNPFRIFTMVMVKEGDELIIYKIVDGILEPLSEPISGATVYMP